MPFPTWLPLDRRTHRPLHAVPLALAELMGHTPCPKALEEIKDREKREPPPVMAALRNEKDPPNCHDKLRPRLMEQLDIILALKLVMSEKLQKEPAIFEHRTRRWLLRGPTHVAVAVSATARLIVLVGVAAHLEWPRAWGVCAKS